MLSRSLIKPPRHAAEGPASPTASCSANKQAAASTFISHSCKYNFFQFFVALEARFKDQPDVFFWIDIFSHNQHEELTSDEWITQFEQHIVRIRYTVMIVFPWDSPIPFTRLTHPTCLPIYLPTYYRGALCSTTRRTECPSRCTWRRQFLDLAQRDPGQAMLIFSRISTLL